MYNKNNYTYIIRCGDGSLYTGWTNHLGKRFREHQEGKGAKYTRGRNPIRLAYAKLFDSKEEAMKMEYEIKQMPRKEKEKLNIEAIIFDVDGTLWDTTDLIAKAWAQAAKEVGAEPTEKITGEVLKKEFGKPMEQIVDDLFPKENKSLKKEIFDRCRIIEHNMLQHTNEKLLYEGIRETIITLAQRYRVMIVSNCQVGYIPLFLRKSELEEIIEDFECYGNTHKSKAENIKAIMERNRIGTAIYVGDTEMDLAAANEAKVPFVQAAYGFGKVARGQLAINKPVELLEILETL